MVVQYTNAVLLAGTRDSCAALLLGQGGHVVHRENGIIFSFDITRCMFSSGNVTERMRMARIAAGGETIVDLFAGIGYFTLPLLVHAGKVRLVPSSSSIAPCSGGLKYLA